MRGVMRGGKRVVSGRVEQCAMGSGAPRLLPSGTVTFVFTDIEGSSRLFRNFGDGYVGLLERHNELLRGVWGVHGGCEVKTEGDAFFVAFAETAAV